VKASALALRDGPLYVRDWGEAGSPALLYWDGLGGCGLHANELAPVLAREYGLRVISPDPPGHGESPALPADSYRPSVLAEVSADLLAELGVDRAVFVGFSWGARVGCSFAARFPERTVGLALIDGGYVDPGDVGADLTADFATCVAEARQEIEEDSFVSWDAYFAFERESLRRWTPALEAAHRAAMRETDGRVVPILEPETLGAIKHGGRREPATDTYPAIAAAGVPVLLLTAPEPEVPEAAEQGVKRFRAALPEARVESVPDGIHDLVSYAPARVAELIGEFVAASAVVGQPPP
jgi:pimeloyl-ACP methyl ester carboxylesterase